jgi:hypothetical protein
VTRDNTSQFTAQSFFSSIFTPEGTTPGTQRTPCMRKHANDRMMTPLHGSGSGKRKSVRQRVSSVMIVGRHPSVRPSVCPSICINVRKHCTGEALTEYLIMRLDRMQRKTTESTDDLCDERMPLLDSCPSSRIYVHGTCYRNNVAINTCCDVNHGVVKEESEYKT